MVKSVRKRGVCMPEIYLKQAKTTTIIIALVSILQAILAIVGLVTVVLVIPNQEELKLTQAVIRTALVNTSINVIFFVLFSVLFLLAYRRLRKGLLVRVRLYMFYIVFMILSIILGMVNGGFNLSSLLIPGMLILLSVIAISSLRKGMSEKVE
ncbi:MULTISPECIES: hypothetical protein [unclassified Listeria]|uniref:hypothetical protein n=2 Tax=Listeriaceae TaxID=186820 RepID=UPI002100E3A6|nr:MULTISPECIES: hypothetical protein [unclassified Listeria]